MLRKDIIFEDFDGETKTQPYYFNLTKAECIELQLSEPGGWADKMELVAESGNAQEIIKVFKEIILRAYGIRMPDGSFFKAPEQAQAFSMTEAYSSLFMELLENPAELMNFLKGLMPKDIVAQVEAHEAGAKTSKIDAQVGQKAVYDELNERAQRKGNNMTKEEILRKMRKSSRAGRALSASDVANMTELEIQEAIEDGCTFEGI